MKDLKMGKREPPNEEYRDDKEKWQQLQQLAEPQPKVKEKVNRVINLTKLQ